MDSNWVHLRSKHPFGPSVCSWLEQTVHFCPCMPGLQTQRPVICSQSSRTEPKAEQPQAVDNVLVLITATLVTKPWWQTLNINVYVSVSKYLKFSFSNHIRFHNSLEDFMLFCTIYQIFFYQICFAYFSTKDSRHTTQWRGRACDCHTGKDNPRCPHISSNRFINRTYNNQIIETPPDTHVCIHYVQ